MTVPPILQRHPALRWLAPIGIACIAGLAATGVFTSRASSTGSLPSTTPAALIAAVQEPDAPGFSGTVVSHLSLGLPELPSIGGAGAGLSFSTLLSGSHTLQVWYGGPKQQRVALLGATEETDLFRDGRQLWRWSSADHSAVHAVLPAGAPSAGRPALPASIATLTPMQLARQALGALDRTTRVEVEADHSVADRSTYELVITPRTTATKVSSVRIAVDGQTKVPLGVQIFARGDDTAAVDVAFTNIVFAPQPARNFQFTPPPDATIRQAGGDTPARAGGTERTPGRPVVSVIGSGWTRVLDIQGGTQALAELRRTSVLGSLTPVSGRWGRGYLLDSELVSALVTDDGRILAGAVEPRTLYAAAGRR